MDVNMSELNPSVKLDKNRATLRGFAKIQTLVLVIGLALTSYCFVAAQGSAQGKNQAARLFAKATPEDYIGSAACAECHGSKVENFAQSPHAMFMTNTDLPDSKRGCEGCHGPGKLHTAEENSEVIAFRKMSPAESSAACLRCHETTLTASHWKRTEHANANVSCVSCHQIHPDSDPDLPGLKKGADARAVGFTAKVDKMAMLRADEATLCGSCHASATGDFRNAYHHPVPEGTMVCSDCHSAHPSKTEKSKSGGFKDKCVTCHTEKAGPFVYEHQPVAGFSSDGCAECHKPHGSNNHAMLNANSRGLCGQCHTDKLATHFPNQRCWNSGCHVSLHGSNTNRRFFTP